MAERLERGLYERILSEALARDLAGQPLTPRLTGLCAADAGDRLGLHLAQLVERAVATLPDKSRVARGVALTRALVDALARALGDDDWRGDSPVEPGQVLKALGRLTPTGAPEELDAPLLPLLDTTLLTNAPGEPNVLHQLRAEIPSAYSISVVMAFIRRSGVRPFLDALRRHCAHGRGLRVLTTVYTGSTEAAALAQLQELGADVRVSYDTSSTRLHAKAWLFERAGGISTAYVGSSNMTHAAQVDGLEWNVRASSARNAPVLDKVRAVFEAYWEGGDFVPFDPAEFARCTEGQRPAAATLILPPTELRLEPFQERLLEQIEVARAAGRHANLLVSATGTGKTAMAAVDYRRLRLRLRRSRLLFVAHRMELLEQSLRTFQHALGDTSFGELWAGDHTPTHWEHVFASIQSLRATGYAHLARDHFDVVIVDEFHHAAAPSYDALLAHVQPRELLGLTATPERADGRSVLTWFDGHVAAELRLWDAIDQHRLAPFHYFGVHDGTDLSQVGWTRGHGYDVAGLTNIYTLDDRWAGLVLREVERHVDDTAQMRALGFCVSVAHARFMARTFTQYGVSAVAVWGDSPEAERHDALRRLRDGEVNVVFSVDLFNEGIDVPRVDTLLMLRPTDSATLFLQQLGRGLRRAEGKPFCVVLDFIGNQRREFRFDQRFRALLGGTRRDLERQVQQGFPFLPAGCQLELAPAARDVILDSVRNALPSQWAAKARELAAVAAVHGQGVTLARFLQESGLELDDVYANQHCWSDLRASAELTVADPGPDEVALRRAAGRLRHVDDRARLDAYRTLIASPNAPRLGAEFATRDGRFARMLAAQLLYKRVANGTSLDSGLDVLWRHPQVLAELRDLFDVLAERIAYQHRPLHTHPELPLQVHGRYTRIEILAAFEPKALARVHSWQTGVRWLEHSKTDLLAFTLDKTSGQFSPTTRYKDHAISRELIHWESQSVTRADSETGLRYQQHLAHSSYVMLFARERADDRAFWFLGPATFVRHVGERPMAITWRLHQPLPGDLFAAFAAAVA